MTGKEIINIIQQNGLEDFELKIFKEGLNEKGWGYEIFFIDIMVDINHLDKTVIFDIKK